MALLFSAPWAYSADSTPHMNTKLCGADESYCTDVELIDGKKRALVDAIVVVEEVFGKDPHGTSWFYIGTAEDASGVGLAGDTVRVQIPAAVTPIGTVYPAVDVTTTVTSGMVASSNPEVALATQICTDLESDANFLSAQWRCIKIKDHSGVFIESKLFNEFGERTAWSVTATGTTVITQAFTSFIRRGLPTELARSPNDPRQGILGISGTVISTPGGIGDIIVLPLTNGSASSDMRIDCAPYVAGTCDFTLSCSSTQDRYVNSFSVFGGCKGIKFGQHLCKNSKLTNGIQIEVRSQAETLNLPIIYATEDWKNKFAFGPSGPGGQFRIDVQAGVDQFISSWAFGNPALIRKCGTAPTPNDYIVIRIRDDLNGSPGGNLAEFSALAFGFEKTP